MSNPPKSKIALAFYGLGIWLLLASVFSIYVTIANFANGKFQLIPVLWGLLNSPHFYLAVLSLLMGPIAQRITDIRWKLFEVDDA
jgi:hypothetical protein